MVNQEDIYSEFGLKKSDLETIESSNKPSIELQLKTLRLTNG